MKGEGGASRKPRAKQQPNEMTNVAGVREGELEAAEEGCDHFPVSCASSLSLLRGFVKGV